MKAVYLSVIIVIVGFCIMYIGLFIAKKIGEKSWRKKLSDKFIIPDEVPPAKEP